MQPPGPGYPPPAGTPPAGAQPAGGTPPQGAPPPGGFHPPPVGAYQGYRPATPTTTEAILSLVLAIVGVTTSCFPVSLVAVYYGVKARRQAREQGEPNNTNGTLGLVGIILGAVFGGLWGIFWLFYGVMILASIGMMVAATAFGGP